MCRGLIMVRQRTLRESVEIKGIGLHSGEDIYLTLRPAPTDTGIIFCRTDLAEKICIPATAENVGDTTLSTALVKDGVRISTIEHLMAAFSGLGIDNAYVDVTAQEIPVMDGSAASFVAAIQKIGTSEQDAPKKFIKILQKVEVNDGDKIASLDPSDTSKIKFTIDFAHPAFANCPKTLAINLNESEFCEVSGARTFGFVAELDYLRSKNLSRGASLENTIAITDKGIMNEGGLRYEDEFVRHKMLDAIGDIYLAGHSIIGFFSGYKSGHALNNKLIRKLLATQEAWKIVTIE